MEAAQASEFLGRRIITQDGQVVTKYSITALEAILPAADFVRIHRSFIISASKMRSYTSASVQIGVAELPIGKSHQRGVIRILQLNKTGDYS